MADSSLPGVVAVSDDGATSQKLVRLFQPGQIGRLTLKNRIVCAPINMGYGHPEGYVTPHYTAYLTEIARGGVGLIITQVTRIVNEISRLPGSIAIYHDKFIPHLRSLVEAVHSCDTRIFMQLHHPGRRGSEHGMAYPVVAPSAIVHPRTGIVPQELSRGDIARLVERYGEAARRVREAGFDGVEIHGAHGHLLQQFLSPWSNRRTDEYGGSLENRVRFACQVIGRVREAVGPDFPVSFRMCGDEFLHGGITNDDAVQHAPFFVQAGADALHISVGGSESVHRVTHNFQYPAGCMAPLAEAIKKAVPVPVITAGKYGDPTVAEQVLRAGMADFVAIGRPLIADPELPNKAKQGRLADIRPCIYCNLGCIHHKWEGTRIRCTVNPVRGQELEYCLEPASPRKKIMVVGGGLAGMQAAKSLAERGHEVSLYEKSDRLGGQWNIVAAFQPEVAALTRYLVRELDKTGVRVVLNRVVDGALVQQMKPEAVVVAAGASQLLPQLPGIEGEKVVMAREVLQGKVQVGQEVVVVGGRLVGLDVALHLARQGKKVSVTSRRKIARDVPQTLKMPLLEALVQHGVYLYPDSPLHSVVEGGVNVLIDGREILFLKADSVVIAVGSAAEKGLGADLRDRMPGLEIREIGDCVAPRDSLSAIHEAFRVGNEL